jgi:hypothetical protein
MITMKIKFFTIVSAIVLGLLALSSPVRGQAGTQNAAVAKEISKEEAAKKYPPGPKGYLPAVPEYSRSATSNSGFFKSPYSSKMYDCRELKSGALVLDTYAKPPQVFVRP